MAIVNSINEVLHRIRAKLYPNHLPGSDGEYIARTDDEASLDIEAVCAALKNRGGYSGSYDELVAYVKQFYQELVYQLCSGFSVNTGFYSIHLKIGGSWASVNEHFDPAKHPIAISFRSHSALREAVKHITVDIEGLAPVSAWIAEVTDAETGAVNETLTPNEDFIVTGRHIKITKEEDDCGLFVLGPLIPDTAAVETEIAKYTENTASKIIARTPASLVPGEYKLVVRTKYSGGSANLKEMRAIETPFTLAVV
ncbi:DNA-binding domain-containing protein [Breznakiellaceae bacterium SP9]